MIEKQATGGKYVNKPFHHVLTEPNIKARIGLISYQGSCWKFILPEHLKGIPTLQPCWEPSSCHTPDHTQESRHCRELDVFPCFHPRWDLSQITDTRSNGQREAHHHSYLTYWCRGYYILELGSHIKTPSLLCHGLSWESSRNDAAIASRFQIGFCSSSSLSIQTQVLLGKLHLVSWHLQVQPAIQNILNEKNHYFSFELTFCPFSGILRVCPHFSLTIHVHNYATEKGVHHRSSHLTTNVQIVPKTYQVAYTSYSRLHLYFYMELLSQTLQKLQLTVCMIDQIFRSQGLPKTWQRSVFSESNSLIMVPMLLLPHWQWDLQHSLFTQAVTKKYCGIPSIVEKVNSLFSYFRCRKHLKSP